MGEGQCLCTIAEHTDMVWSVMMWNSRVISRSLDKKIMVHSILSLMHEATLDAHTCLVLVLALSCENPYSTGLDWTIC